MDSVLVLDGEQRAALAIARSLVRHGVPVEIASAHPAPLAASTRGAGQAHRYPEPGQSAAQFTRWLATIDSALLVPVTDATTMLSRTRALGGDFGYEALTNKALLVEAALSAGIPVPRGSMAGSLGQAISCASRVSYPVVIKPAQSRVLLDGKIISTTVTVASSPAELERILGTSAWFPVVSVLLQEFVPGHGAGVFCLYDRDRALAWFAHRRLREKPPAGGVSVLSESVPVDPLLQGYAETLLRAAGYRGAAMVEFRIGRDGRPYLMEVNARFWGSLQLAIDCGVDFPWLYYQMARNMAVEPVLKYAVGRRLRWLLGDLDNLLIQLRDPALGTSAKLSAVARFSGTSLDPRCRQEILRIGDLQPGLVEARQWIAAVTGHNR